MSLWMLRIYHIPQFTQCGYETFASIQQEVATIQAHESAGWIYVEEAAKERQTIMDLYVKYLKALREHSTLGKGIQFWGYRIYTYGLFDKKEE